MFALRASHCLKSRIKIINEFTYQYEFTNIRIFVKISRLVDNLMFIASLLIVVGVVFLLKNLGLITGDIWGIIWPLILILFGVYVLLKNYRYRMFWERVWRKLE